MSGFAITTYDPEAVGILSARLFSLETAADSGNNNITLGVNSDRYQAFLAPSQSIDNLGITTINIINDRKTGISTVGGDDTFYGAQEVYATEAAATGAVSTIYGDVVSSVGVASAIRFPVNAIFVSGRYLVQENTGAFGQIMATQSATNRALIIGIGQTGFNTTDTCRTGVSTIFGDNSTIVGVPNEVALVGFGNIWQDVSVIYRYPNLEPVDTSVSNPYAGGTSSILVTGNAGQGIANTFYPNAVDGSNIVSGANFIGTVFTFDTSSDVAAATSITNMSNEITGQAGLRTDVDSFTNTSNIIKPYKNDFAVNVWSLSKVNADRQTEIADLNTAITILSDPQYGGPY